VVVILIRKLAMMHVMFWLLGTWILSGQKLNTSLEPGLPENIVVSLLLVKTLIKMLARQSAELPLVP
jgi:hypothetical protein